MTGTDRGLSARPHAARWLTLLLGSMLFVCAVPGLGHADKEKAKAAFKEANVQYNLGNFEESVTLFKKAYEEWPDAAFLFNVAQGYRQMGDCKQALFFYRRFLSIKRDAPNRDEVEKRIAELEVNCKEQEGIKTRPPDGVASPDKTDDDKTGTETGTGTGTDTGTGTGTDVATSDDDDDGDDDDDDDDVGGSISAGAPAKPSLLSVSALVGPSFLGLGDLEVPAQVSFGLGGGYPLAISPVLTIEAGALFTYTPVPWDAGGGASGTASLISLLANAGASYELMPKLSARADLGLGVQIFGGLADAGNVFLEPGAMASGAIGVFNVRVAIGAEYAITNNIAVQAFPVVYAYSPTKDGLRADITALTRFEAVVGVGYRM